MKRRNEDGVAITEAAASLSLLLPLVILIIFVTQEVSMCYFLKSTLAQGARRAARDLAIAYGQNPLIAGDRALQDATVFNNIRIPNVINSSAQFNNPVFNTAVSPNTVAVTVRYIGNSYGLPPFPNPDPLYLGSKFKITADNTYRLE